MENTDDKQSQLVRDGVEPRAPEPNITPKPRKPRAVAIKDSSNAQSETPAMPRIIAKGEGGVAEQILQIAWANDIKVREDADLIDVLAAIDVESDIPIEAFAAVAEILSYVYRANADMGAQGPDDRGWGDQSTGESPDKESSDERV